MLIGIHPLLRGPLLAALDALGHGDSLVVADANFPAQRLSPAVIDLAGATAPEAVAAIATVLPVDPAEDVVLMDSGEELPPVQAELLAAAGVPPSDPRVRLVERRAFYDAAARAQLVVLTGERRPYGNLVLHKGVVPPPPER